MKNVVLFGLLGLVGLMGCRQEKQVAPPEILPFTATLFAEVSHQLDFSTLRKVTGKENQEVWLVQFTGDTNRLYAACAKAELLYERKFTGARSGYIDLTRGQEKARMSFVNGTRVISAVSTNYHGGEGFCQREKGESFGKCFETEADEFCDSFASCIALGTQPFVSILIGIACSCEAGK